LATHPKGDILMSGSIDKTNKLYLLDNSTGRYDFVREVKYHDGFVLCIIPLINGEGFISAGRDNKIFQIDLEGNPVREFNDHTAAVNSLSQAINEEFVSGSWDGTAIVWDFETGLAKEKLTGHTHATAVLTLANGITITGSQDKAIRLWFKGKQEKVIENAHDDIVRCFTEVPELNAFASCSNDETVKLWSLDGTHLIDYRGHSGFVFAVDTLETGEVVSGGDDCTVKIWKDGLCKQTIQMPKTVWTITHNKFGDLLVGCEDKTIRTFTRDIARQDHGDEFALYE
jgi:phospholipase A-2-activating protein